jgi:hypothetical protein
MATEWDGAPVVAAVNQRLVDADAAGRRPEGTLTHTEATKRFREFIRSYREDQHFVLRCVRAPATRIVLRIAFVVAVCRRGGCLASQSVPCGWRFPPLIFWHGCGRRGWRGVVLLGATPAVVLARVHC